MSKIHVLIHYYVLNMLLQFYLLVLVISNLNNIYYIRDVYIL